MPCCSLAAFHVSAALYRGCPARANQSKLQCGQVALESQHWCGSTLTGQMQESSSQDGGAGPCWRTTLGYNDLYPGTCYPAIQIGPRTSLGNQEKKREGNVNTPACPFLSRCQKVGWSGCLFPSCPTLRACVPRGTAVFHRDRLHYPSRGVLQKSQGCLFTRHLLNSGKALPGEPSKQRF